MKQDFINFVVVIFLGIIGLGTISLKLALGISWSESIYLVIQIIFSSELIDLSGRGFTAKIVVYLITLFGAAIQLGIIVLIISLVIKWIILNQVQIEDQIDDFISKYNFRQIYTVIFFSIMFFSMVVFKTIEGKTWLDAFYFTIVTISTVGFGDITATHTITKIMTIFLILNGITFLGFASQIILNRIIDFQLSKKHLLPKSPLDLENHIIIGGYGSKGRRLAQLFKERTYTVVIVERDEDRAKLAKFNDFQVINADITKPGLLDLLSLEKAGGMFLLLTDDNLVIQTGIIARSIAPNLDIFGEFLSLPTYNIARYAGINKPVSLFGFLTNELHNYFIHEEVKPIISLRELRQQETSLGFVQVPIDYNYKEVFDNPLIIGEISTGLNEVYLQEKLAMNYVPPPTHTNQLLLAVDKDELDKKLKGQTRQQKNINRLIFAGYSDLTDSLIERLDFPTKKIVILWHQEKYGELLQEKTFKKYQWELETGHLLLDQIVKDNDLIICSFDDITSSLIVGVTLRDMERKTQLIQLVPYEYDIEPLIKVGADKVLTPQQIISNAFLKLFLKENNISPSLVFTNGHIYEMLVTPDSFYEDKVVRELKKNQFNILFIRKSGDNQFKFAIDDLIIRAGDRIVVHIQNEKIERLDTQPRRAGQHVKSTRF